MNAPREIPKNGLVIEPPAFVTQKDNMPHGPLTTEVARAAHQHYQGMLAGIGDLNSTDKGSGARFNADKPDFSLVPLHILSHTMISASDGDQDVVTAGEVIGLLGDYQERSDEGVGPLFKAMALLTYAGWEECARVFMYGKDKYAAWNWAKGMAWSVPLACAVRHLLAMADGEMVDPESGLPHRGHVFCNLVMLITYADSFREGNNLPTGMFSVQPA